MKRFITSAWLFIAALAVMAQSAPTSVSLAESQPFDQPGWDDVKMYVPSEVCKKHGLWKDVDAARDSRMKLYASKFPAVFTSSHPKSTLSFAFNGDLFGIYDIAGPEMGELEVYVDGQMVCLKHLADTDQPVFEATPLDGTHFLDRRADERSSK